MSVLELRSVSRFYGQGASKVAALTDVSMTVEAGELVAVMGPSGSGKSTLLTIAGTLEEASSGDVLVDGERVATLSVDARAALRRHLIGYVFQEFNLLSGLTAVENVAIPLELDGQNRRSAQATAMAVLDSLGLTALADRFPDELSGGERQRTAIARAVVGERRLLLADEPTGALDSLNGEAVLRLLRQACRGGVAGVLVSHDARLAARADRIIYLRDGRIVDESPATPGPESLLANDPRP